MFSPAKVWPVNLKSQPMDLFQKNDDEGFTLTNQGKAREHANILSLILKKNSLMLN